MDRTEMTKRLGSVPLFAQLEPHALELIAALERA